MSFENPVIIKYPKSKPRPTGAVSIWRIRVINYLRYLEQAEQVGNLDGSDTGSRPQNTGYPFVPDSWGGTIRASVSSVVYVADRTFEGRKKNYIFFLLSTKWPHATKKNHDNIMKTLGGSIMVL
ncbi:hypothetical protein TNCT_49881 [Trichonephila clavata]|uniref:Uncharacterized protein n=1 Tax=Trichonephila clavata TaxID=2740835 RepID=A0A8X6GW15_TRICU|nr:hypothetical protein TNCT_49881 [Trichonephila clavata]